MLMYAVFIVVRSLKEKKEISKKNLLLLGVTSGVVLWIKYTMLGFYLGWVILPRWPQKNMKSLLKKVYMS